MQHVRQGAVGPDPAAFRIFRHRDSDGKNLEQGPELFELLLEFAIQPGGPFFRAPPLLILDHQTRIDGSRSAARRREVLAMTAQMKRSADASTPKLMTDCCRVESADFGRGRP